MLPVTGYILAVCVLLASAVFYLFFYPRWRHRKLARQALPGQWSQWIAQAVPGYRMLTPERRRRLEDGVKIFVAEKDFYGCDGLEITDEHRVTIAAQACLLVLNRSLDDYAGLRAILLYPAAFRVPHRPDEDGIVTVGDDVHLGESWGEGRVILSWADIATERQQRRLYGAADSNVVLHEFAHQLDRVEGVSAAMDAPADDATRTLAQAYQALVTEVDAGLESVIDPYGATDPAEFLAVATELFFEQPVVLREANAGLYAVLGRFYRFDPLESTG